MVIVMFLLLAACAPPPLRIGSEVPADVAALANSVTEAFFAAFPAHRRCGAGVRLQTSWNLSDRAVYSRDTATIALRIPWTAPRLSQTLAHELAHHLEAACPAHLKLRRVFLTALGYQPNHPWFDAPRWEETPSEIYAEAASVVALGEDTDTRIPVDPELIDLVARWGRGEDLTHPTAAP